MNQTLRIVTLVLVFTLAACVSKPSSKPSRHCYHSNEQVEQTYGYCQAVSVGDTLHISGSVGAGDMPEAIKKAYDHIGATLAAHDMDFSDVVSETVFTTNIDQLIEHQGVRKAYYGDVFPASSWIQIERLFLPEFVIEVEVTAVRMD